MAARALPALPAAARAYAHTNFARTALYYDYHDFNIAWAGTQRYAVVRRIGRGKYSNVFQAVDAQTQQPVTLKVLKTIPYRAVQREVSIVTRLADCAGVSHLLDTVQDPVTRTLSLVLQWQEATPFRQFYQSLDAEGLRDYCGKLLSTLDQMHSRGIMHRDVKPNNVLYDPSTRSLHLIDFGLAEYYFPGVRYNVRVASRCYKAPEILIGDGVGAAGSPLGQSYDYSLDMWGFGCLLASFLFRREPFFGGADNAQQLAAIVGVLGSHGLRDLCRRAGVEPPPVPEVALPPPLESLVPKTGERLASAEALDLLARCLAYDRAARPTAAEALAHPFLRTARDKSLAQTP